MQARLGLAVVDVGLAGSTSHSGDARARKVSNEIHASRPLEARIRGALVDVNVAAFAFVAGSASTLVIVDLVDAGCAILARNWQTLVDVDVAVLTGEAWLAVALITSWTVDTNALTTEVFGVRLFALVNVVAIDSAVALLADAVKLVRSARSGPAGRVVLTRTRETSAVAVGAFGRCHFMLAELSIKASRTTAVAATVRQTRAAVLALTFILIRESHGRLTASAWENGKRTSSGFRSLSTIDRARLINKR